MRDGIQWLAEAEEGNYPGRPGSDYVSLWAGVRRVRSGQGELTVRAIWGHNNVVLEEHGRVTRRYRADNWNDLLRVAVSEVRTDTMFIGHHDSLVAAAKSAIFDAADAEAEAGTV